MRHRTRIMVAVWAMTLGVAQAEEAAAPPSADAATSTAMEAMQRLGSPSEGHPAFEPLIGAWPYEARGWMAPDAPPQAMAGTATNTAIFGGRFLKQEVIGHTEGQPVFKGLGFTGYDNLRQEYQSVWFDNMMTGMMVGAGRFDAATRTLTDQGEFSCPVTGEPHRWFRTAWTVVDANHTTYETYARVPDGREFKSLEIRYTRAP